MTIFKVLFISILVCLVFRQEIVCNFLMFLRNTEDKDRIAIRPYVACWSFCISAVTCMANTSKTTWHWHFPNLFITVLKSFEQNGNVVRACHAE